MISSTRSSESASRSSRKDAPVRDLALLDTELLTERRLDALVDLYRGKGPLRNLTGRRYGGGLSAGF